MDQMEQTVVIFADKRKGIQNERGRCHAVEGGVQCRFGCGQIGSGQAPRQGDMEPEVLHHVRIAPGCQVAVLGRAEAARSAARQFSLGRGGAKGIEVADTCRGQLVQRLFAAQRAQRKKAAEPGQVQTVQPHRREPGAEACAGGREVPGWYNEGLAQHLSGEGALALRRAPKILEPGFLELSELGGSFARWSDRDRSGIRRTARP